MMTVKDLWQVYITKNFSVVAGDNALHKPIESVEILDFEFVKGISPVRDTIFNPNSLVLSSLLFAKKNPELLLNTIKKLIELNVSALAYKPVIFSEFPQEVLDYANDKAFPILRFGGDEFFEDIILEVLDYMKEKNHTLYLEKMMERFIIEKIQEEQINGFIKQMNKPFEKYVAVATIRLTDSENDRWMESFLQFSSFLKTGIVCKYRRSIFILFSNKNEQFHLDTMLNDWMDFFKLPKENLIISYSQVHQTKTGLHLAVRESFYTNFLAEMEGQSVFHYEQLGSEKILIELYRRDAQFANDYVKSYLGEVLDNGELLDTATTFVMKKGNVKEIAAAHFCHPNTIRYRLTKIRQLVDASSNENVFYEHISMGIKLYLLDRSIKKFTTHLEFVQK